MMNYKYFSVYTNQWRTKLVLYNHTFIGACLLFSALELQL